MAIGLALEGFHSIPEIQFLGFVFEVMDSVVAQAALLVTVLAVVMAMPNHSVHHFGGEVHTPELHADNLEGLLAQSPGIRLLFLLVPYDAKTCSCHLSVTTFSYLLRTLKLYRSFREEVPEAEYTIPLEPANVVKEGNHVIHHHLRTTVKRLKRLKKLEKTVLFLLKSLTSTT